MNDLLSEYEQQFAIITAEITAKISTLLNPEVLHSKILKLNEETRILISEARELLEHMDLEVREASQDQRERLRNRVKSYGTELERLEEEFTRSKQLTRNSEGLLREELFAGGSDNSMTVGQEQRQHLLNNTEALERTSERLSQSYKAAIESELVGAQVLNDLQHQRDTLMRARDRLRNTDDDLDTSSRTLNNMIQRAMQNKFFLWAVVGLVVIFFCIIIYFKLT